jgi:hypothetical protein
MPRVFHDGCAAYSDDTADGWLTKLPFINASFHMANILTCL